MTIGMRKVRNLISKGLGRRPRHDLMCSDSRLGLYGPDVNEV